MEAAPMVGVLVVIVIGAMGPQASTGPGVPRWIAAPTAPTAEPSPDVTDRAAFDREAERVGRDADAHVRLALWAEQAGWADDRARHLSVALLLNPGHPMARAMLGQVWDGRRWVTAARPAPDAVSDPLDEYARRRAKASRTVPDQLALATWCEQNGLPEQAREHLTEALRLDPRRESTWRRLGYKKVGGRWLSAEQAAEREAFQKAQAAATAQWKPQLARLRKQLGSSTERESALAELAQISDPLAVPAIMIVFGNDAAGARMAVQLLGQVRGPASSQALVELALDTADLEILRVATETLAQRDPREFAGRLVALVAKPTKYEVQRGVGTNEARQLRVETPGYNLVRRYQPVAADPVTNPASLLLPGEYLVWGADGLPYAGRRQAYFTTPNPAVKDLAADLKADPGNAVATLANFARTSPTNGPWGMNGVAQGWSSGVSVLGGGLLSPVAVDPLTGMSYFVTYRPLLMAGNAGIQLRNAEAVRMAQERLELDVLALESRNTRVRAVNERVLPILMASTGQDFGPNPEAWRQWWNALVAARPEPTEVAPPRP
jgi:hypothetical protein